MTEWSTTSSDGTLGLISASRPPRAAAASRMAAKSASAGTPLVSCRKTRDGLRSTASRAAPPQDSSACTCSGVTRTPSSWRSRFSSTIFRLIGSPAGAMSQIR
jgi:hypothetical protein